MSRRKLDDQRPNIETLFSQLRKGRTEDQDEVLFVGYAYAGHPNGGLYLHAPADQAKLQSYMNPSGSKQVTFYAVPWDEM